MRNCLENRLLDGIGMNKLVVLEADFCSFGTYSSSTYITACCGEKVKISKKKNVNEVYFIVNGVNFVCNTSVHHTFQKPKILFRGFGKFIPYFPNTTTWYIFPVSCTQSATDPHDVLPVCCMSSISIDGVYPWLSKDIIVIPHGNF